MHRRTRGERPKEIKTREMGLPEDGRHAAKSGLHVVLFCFRL